MFTGIVEHLGTIVECKDIAGGARLMIAGAGDADDLALGESIAVNGCCLTVVEIAAEHVAFDVGPETLARTNLGQLQPGSRVNLERSLQAGSRIGGHFVSGHVDAVGTLASREANGEFETFWFEHPASLTRQMASKASIAVDGVSLTLVDVEPGRFSIMLIPHTLAVTTLGRLQPGGSVNLETDLLAKYVESQLNYRA